MKILLCPQKHRPQGWADQGANLSVITYKLELHELVCPVQERAQILEQTDLSSITGTWASQFTTLSLSFIICKMAETIALTSQCRNDKSRRL